MIKSFKLFILLILCFVSINTSKAETLEQLSEELNDVKNELSNLVLQILKKR